MKKKSLFMVLTLTIALSFAFSLSSITVFADEDDYIEIRTSEDLYNIRNDLSANYRLMNDIDLTEATAIGGSLDNNEKGWDPIGNKGDYCSEYDPFTGVLDGNGYSIIGMRIHPYLRGNSSYVGLFSQNGGTIKDLKLKDVDIKGGVSQYEDAYIGAFAGINTGSIIRCSSSGSIKGHGYRMSGASALDGNAFLAGISCGRSGNGLIQECYSRAVIGSSYEGNSDGVYVGMITYGPNSGNQGYKGNTVENSYAQAGLGAGIFKNCYYVNSSGSGWYYDDTGKGTSYNATQMNNKASYRTFDFNNVWTIETATDYKYPQLRNNMMDTVKHVDVIEWKTEPSKIDYYTDENIDPTGGVFTAYYMDDTHEDIEVTKDMLSGYDMTQLGMQTVTVTFREGTLTYDILTSTRPEVKSLTLETMPDKTEFARGTAFDFTGATAKVEYVNGKTEIIPIPTEECTGGNINQSGTYTITFEKFGKTITFEVKVVPVKPTGIRITSLPTKTTYIEGQSLDLTGLVVKLDYNSGKTETITDYTVGEYENSIGTKEITITYEDFTASFSIEFVEKKLKAIMVTTQPSKAKYVVGEAFDRTGMVVKAVYDNGISEEITDYTVSDIPEATGWQTLTVSYEGKTTTIRVMVEAKELVSIFVSQMPLKMTYKEGETFDPEGMVVMGNYNDVLNEEITDYTLSGTTLNKVGESKITVLYEGMIASFNVTVVEKQLVKITVTPPTKTEYIVGEAFDDTGMVVKAVYDNGKSETVSGYTVSGFGDTAEDNAVTVEYGGKMTAFIVTIHTPEAKWTVIQAPTCTAGGSHELHCADCGKVLKTEELNALGHDWSDWETVDAPNCTDKGSQKRVCGRCNIEEFKDVDPNGHTWVETYVTDLAPTCTSEGSESWHCSECGVSDPTHTRAIDKLPHNLGEWTTTKEPTCAVAGVKQRACADCDYLETVEIPATGDHTFGDWASIKEPTCTEDGSKERECTVCHLVETESIAATGKHEYGDWMTVKEPTCTDEGSKERECTVCHLVETENIAATGKHEYGDWTTVKEPTCTDKGSKERTCSMCGDKETESLDALGHKWNTKYTVDKKATYAAAGSKSIHCSVCNAKKAGSAVAIPKLKVKPTTLSKLTPAKKAITVKWKKGSGITGYQIQLALNSKFTSGKKTVTITKSGTVSKKITKLKAKKKYYVRVRTYKTVSGKKYYSTWSKYKYTKTK